MLVTSLPLWLQAALVGYVLPDDGVNVTTKIRLNDLRSNVGHQTHNALSGDLSYPGLIPDVSVKFEATPTTTGMDYVFVARKAVGFYGVRFKAVDYDKGKFNEWVFPVERRNFGFMAFLKGSRVIETSSIHFEDQVIVSDSAVGLLTPVISEHSSSDIIISAEHYCCSRIAYQMAREFTYEFSFLPCYEVWELTWDAEIPPPPGEKPRIYDCPTATASGLIDAMIVYCDSGG